jgi:RNA polymerase sigma-70 factor (ECF subfamily)
MQLCRGDHWSDDLVQDTMLKAYTYFHTYKEGTNCRAWLFQICKNSFINDYRRKRYEPVAVDFLEETSLPWYGWDSKLHRGVLPHPIDDGSLQMPSGFLSDEVTASFDALPPDYQTALILCDIEEYTYEEIANFTQVPIGTVRSRIHRGRKMLARQLADYAHKQGYSSTVKN